MLRVAQSWRRSVCVWHTVPSHVTRSSTTATLGCTSSSSSPLTMATPASLATTVTAVARPLSTTPTAKPAPTTTPFFFTPTPDAATDANHHHQQQHHRVRPQFAKKAPTATTHRAQAARTNNTNNTKNSLAAEDDDAEEEDTAATAVSTFQDEDAIDAEEDAHVVDDDAISDDDDAFDDEDTKAVHASAMESITDVANSSNGGAAMTTTPNTATTIAPLPVTAATPVAAVDQQQQQQQQRIGAAPSVSSLDNRPRVWKPIYRVGPGRLTELTTGLQKPWSVVRYTEVSTIMKWLADTEKEVNSGGRVPAGVLLAMIHRIGHQPPWVLGAADPRWPWVQTLFERFTTLYPPRLLINDEMPLLVMFSALRRVRRSWGVNQAVQMFEEFRARRDVQGKLVQPSKALWRAFFMCIMFDSSTTLKYASIIRATDAKSSATIVSTAASATSSSSTSNPAATAIASSSGHIGTRAISNTLIRAFTHRGDLPKVLSIAADKEPNVRLLNTILKAAVAAGDIKRVLKFFKQFKDAGVAPDQRTLGILVEAFASVGDLKNMRLIVDQMTKTGVSPGPYAYQCILRALCRERGHSAEIVAMVHQTLGAGLIPGMVMISVFRYLSDNAETAVMADIYDVWIAKGGVSVSQVEEAIVMGYARNKDLDRLRKHLKMLEQRVELAAAATATAVSEEEKDGGASAAAAGTMTPAVMQTVRQIALRAFAREGAVKDVQALITTLQHKGTLQPDALHSLLLAAFVQLYARPDELERRVWELVTMMRGYLAHPAHSHQHATMLFYHEVASYMSRKRRIVRDPNLVTALYQDMLQANVQRVAIDQWPMAWMSALRGSQAPALLMNFRRDYHPLFLQCYKQQTNPLWQFYDIEESNYRQMLITQDWNNMIAMYRLRCREAATGGELGVPLNRDLFIAATAAFAGRGYNWDGSAEVVNRMEAYGLSVDLDVLFAMCKMLPVEKKPASWTRVPYVNAEKRKLWHERLMWLEGVMRRHGILLAKDSAPIETLPLTPHAASTDPAQYSEQTLHLSSECHHLRVALGEAVTNAWVAIATSPRHIEYWIRRPVKRLMNADSVTPNQAAIAAVVVEPNHPMHRRMADERHAKIPKPYTMKPPDSRRKQTDDTHGRGNSGVITAIPPITNWHSVPMPLRTAVFFSYHQLRDTRGLRAALQRLVPLVYVDIPLVIDSNQKGVRAPKSEVKGITRHREPSYIARYWQLQLLELEAIHSDIVQPVLPAVTGEEAVATAEGCRECIAAGFTLLSQPTTRATLARDVLAIVKSQPSLFSKGITVDYAVPKSLPDARSIRIVMRRTATATADVTDSDHVPVAPVVGGNSPVAALATQLMAKYGDRAKWDEMMPLVRDGLRLVTTATLDALRPKA